MPYLIVLRFKQQNGNMKGRAKLTRSSSIADKCRPTPVSVIPLARWRHVYRVDWRFWTAYSQHCVPFDALGEGIPSSYWVHIWYEKTRLDYNPVKVIWWSTQLFGHNTSTWQTHRQPRRHSNSRPNGLRRAIKTAETFRPYNPQPSVGQFTLWCDLVSARWLFLFILKTNYTK